MAFFLGVLCGIALTSIGFAVRARRRSRAPREQDHLLAILHDELARQRNMLFDAALMRLIRERYHCTEAKAREVSACFQDWLADAASDGADFEVAADGRLHLLAIDQVDRCAREVGLGPPDNG